MQLPLKTGIEMELWGVDRHGELADARVVTDAHRRIESGFVPCMLEVKTELHGTEADLRRDLYTILGAAIEKASMNDLRLVPLGTPFSETDMGAVTPRGRLFERIYGEGVLVSKNSAGTHVHFEKDEVVRQLNLLTALDPALSLVSSSPYYRGERDLDCSRAFAYRTGCGEEFRPFHDLLEYVDTVDDWQGRVDRLYETFRDLAEERGVKRTTVTEHFSPENTVLNPVRLRNDQPTVEWRAPDSTLPSHIVSLAVDVGALLADTTSKRLEYGSTERTGTRIGVPEFDTVRTLGRVAIRSGCRSPRVKTYLEEMGLDVDKYDPVSPHIVGPAALSPVDACAMRLEQSRRLALDLATLTDRTADDAVVCPDVPVRLRESPGTDHRSGGN